jgi:hypothetical protein
MSLKTMTVARLQDLKRQVEAAIHEKIEERRHEIEAELSKLSHFDTGRTNGVTAHVKKKVALGARKRPDERKASAPKQPSKSRKARKKARKPQNIGEPQPLMLAGAQHIEAAAPSAAPASANDIPVDLGVAA